MSNDLIKCTAKVSKVFFPKTPIQNGDFGIVSMELIDTLEGEVEVNKTYNTFIVKGTFCKLNREDEYRLTLKEVIDKKWGKQYELVYLNTVAHFETVEQQKDFLRVSLSEKIIANLYSALPDPIKAIEERDVEALCTVKGIAEKTARKVIDRYETTKDNAEAYVKLRKYNLSRKMVQKLMNKYSSVDTILQKLKDNIYILADEIDGVGFKTVDALALKLGMAEDDPRRVRSFIMYYLNVQANDGNSWVYTQVLVEAIAETCGDINLDIVKNILTDLRENEVIVTNKSRTILGLKKIFDMEMEILEHLDRIAEGENLFKYGEWEKVVDEIENVQGWKYTDQQRLGVKTVLDNQVVLVTGLAGTGKSTVTNAMCKVLMQEGYTVQQCALSGRASQRMKELNGIESKTIHKTVGIGFGGEPLHGSHNPLDADVILLDEASMPDARMYLLLLRAIKTGSKLVIIGDKGQLPSIGIANIFFDLLEYKFPVVELNQVHRQAQASAIISESINLRNQQQLFNSDFTGDMVLGELQDLELNIFKDREELHGKIVRQFLDHLNRHNGDIMKVQIVVPMKARGGICCKLLNESIQSRVNTNVDMGDGLSTEAGYTIYVGDKVINNTNGITETVDGEDVDIYNGNIGIVKSIDVADGSMVVYFTDLRREVVLTHDHIKESIDLAYAITCHKLQGSSCDTVIVGIDFSAYTLLTSEWLYTAITRAESYCMLVGENSAVRYAISKTQSAQKQTFIKLKAQK